MGCNNNGGLIMGKKAHNCPCENETPEKIKADGEPKQVITLVHGTFAKHAKWTHDSAMCDKLQAIDGTLLSRFCWSGGNSHTDRLKAGEDLAEHIKNLANRFTRAKLFLISHSHGGNVAMYALKDLETAGFSNRINGVVTLATPFITLRRRRLHKAVPIAVITLAFFGLLELGFHLWSGNNSTAIDNTILPMVTVLFGLWIIGSAYSVFRYHKSGFGYLDALKVMFKIGNTEDLIKDQLDRLRLRPVEVELMGPKRPTTEQHALKESDADKDEISSIEQSIGEAAPDQLQKLFVVRPLGDEASMGLVVSQFLSWALNLILAGIGGFVSGFRKVGWFSWTWKFVLIVAMAFFLERQLPSSFERVKEAGQFVTGGASSIMGYWGYGQATEFIGVIVMLIIWGILALYVFFGFFSLIGLLVLLFASTPFGPDAMFWNHFASTTAEASPPGPARVYLQSPPPQKEGEPPRKLAHSLIYEDKDVIEEIAKWIRDWGKNKA